MITDWLIPRAISYQDNPENVDWVDTTPLNNTLKFPLKAKAELDHISIHDLAYIGHNGDMLVLKDFNIPEYTTIQGIEVMIDVRRRARISDYTVQLHNNETAIGLNLAEPTIPRDNLSIYGSSTETWGITSFPDLTSPDFGVLLQVGPHPLYPGKDPAIIDRVAIRITYS